MDAHELINDFRARGIRLFPEGGNLAVEPADRLSDADRAAIRQAKPELLALLQPASADDPPGLVLIADAIASAPRAPFENDLAMARAARASVAVHRLLRELSGARLAEARGVCADTARAAANHIRRRNYLAAYELLDNLPARMRALIPQ